MGRTRLDGRRGSITVRRTRGGVPQVQAVCWEDAFFALGWLHARDRGGQVALMRLLGQGRLCECLRWEPGLLEADLYFRRFGFARDAEQAARQLAAPESDYLAAYCRGVSAGWREGVPVPLRLAGYRPEPYRSADALLLLKLTSFVGLAEAQRVGELFVVEALRRGADPALLGELLPALGPVDPQVALSLDAVAPFYPDFSAGLARGTGCGSNAWAVAGTRTASGSPILCNDPHLEVNRLPALGYEAHLTAAGRWVKGLTLPGLPGFLTGRTPDLAWGVTYACADTSDFFAERCRGAERLAGGTWRPFRERCERIARKGRDALEVTFLEGEHGVLEGAGRRQGTHLSWRWVGSGAAGVGSLRGFTGLLECRTVSEAQRCLAPVDIPPLHFVLADREGNIGYRFAGTVPLRSAGWSGLAPAPGWDRRWAWTGVVADGHKPWELNPERGYVASANEARRVADGPLLTTLPLAPYRRQRIEDRLRRGAGWGVAAMAELQGDVLSLEAERLLPLYLRHLPDGPERDLLAGWDRRCLADSPPARLFEAIQRRVAEEFLGRVLGSGWVRELFAGTSLYLCLAGPVADLLERPDTRWLPAEERAGFLGRTLREGVAAWRGERRGPGRVYFDNLFLGARLSRWLGLGRGPYALAGSHATVRAHAAFRLGGRPVVVGPAYRFIADLASDGAWSALPGGPRESPLRRGYACDLPLWLAGRYKDL